MQVQRYFSFGLFANFYDHILENIEAEIHNDPESGKRRAKLENINGRAPS